MRNPRVGHSPMEKPAVGESKAKRAGDGIAESEGDEEGSHRIDAIPR